MMWMDIWNARVGSLMIAWGGSYRAPDLYGCILINIWRRMEDQSQMAPGGIHYVRKICVNRCKSVSKKRPGDTDYTDFMD
jgi:hypothetical protein